MTQLVVALLEELASSFFDAIGFSSRSLQATFPVAKKTAFLISPVFRLDFQGRHRLWNSYPKYGGYTWEIFFVLLELYKHRIGEFPPSSTLRILALSVTRASCVSFLKDLGCPLPDGYHPSGS